MTSAPTTEQRVTPVLPGGRRRSRAASARYYICLVILLLSAAGMQTAARYLKYYFRKEPVPLKRRFTELDWRKLAPRYRPHVVQPKALPPEQEEALGTENYLELRLIDTEKSARDPAALANVFLTYYTGQPDMVPHVPDECYLAGGYERVGLPTTPSLRVPGVNAPDDELPVRVVQFQSRGGRDEPVTVIYFFSVNGDYRNGREGVRFRLADPRERYAYYCKIELSFTDNQNPLQPRQADLQQSLAAAQDLLAKLLPVLIEDHFDWDRARSGPAMAGK
jgi:hypothetical protein